MGKQHSKPCHDCPWRRKSIAGWVGAVMTPEQWCAAAHSENFLWCHTKSFKAQCAGAAIFRDNICKLPRDPKALVLESDKVTVFASDAEMIAHHRKHGKTSAELGS
jgi:hypothetical protein